MINVKVREYLRNEKILFYTNKKEFRISSNYI